MTDKVTNYQQRQELHEADRKQKALAEIRMNRMYQNVFGTPEGQEVFKDMMEFCMTFQQTMTGNSWTYFNEGKRAVGLHLLMRREKGWENEILFLRSAHENQMKMEDDNAG
jgi:hypothetical protein